MTINKNTKFLIVGLGLLGGSYARGLTEKGYYVEAITKDEKDIEYALTHEMIKKGTTEVNEDMIRSADIIIFALYPKTFVEWIETYGELIKPGTIITDVTGVKGAVVDRVQSLLRSDLEFISAHPMAGREVSGVVNSDDSIFAGANYVVTPTEKNTDAAIELCSHLGEVLGFARISTLSPKDHDEIIGFVSQLTHCIAVCLMTCQRTEHLEDYTGDSFRDLTRIARLNDEMWSELFLLNKEALIEQMDTFTGELSRLRELLDKNDRAGLREMMRYSTARRALFDKKKSEENKL